MIYLDYPSHTPVDPEVLTEFCRIEQVFLANPMSNHQAGQAARAEFDRIITTTAQLLGANPKELIFTSGATESNNLAINGITHAGRHNGRHIITNALEHQSVSGPIAVLKDLGYDVEFVDILPDGTIDLGHLQSLLRTDTILLTVPWVDSELGVIQPIKEIAGLLENYPNCRFHVDAAQAVGKLPVSFNLGQKGPHTLSFSPHKFHGLCGSGGLLCREAFLSLPHRGTPTLALAAASLKALELAITGQAEHHQKVWQLRQYVLENLKDRVRVNSPVDPTKSSPYILNLSVPGIKGADFQAALNSHGICVSVKSACAAPQTPSRPVYAISRDKKNAMNSWRLGFSHNTEISEIEDFLSAFDKCNKELV